MTEALTPEFVFYCGAYYPRNYSPLGIWIKYRPGPDRIEAIARGPGWVHVSTPDRELLLVRNTHTNGAPRPLDMGWDEFVPLSLSATVPARSNPVDRYMINYFQHTTLRGQRDNIPRALDSISAGIRKKGSFVNDGKLIQSDSGGYQMLTGRADWIDPLDLAKWYSDNCDEGITLDIPIPEPHLDEEFLMRSAAVQVENTRILQANLPEDFHLFNVVHGSADDSVKHFREYVERDGPDDYLCVAGVYRNDVLQSMNRLVKQLLDEDFKSYKQYHVLGVYSPVMLIPIIRFAALMRKQGRTFTISSDASTPVYTATNRMIHLQRAHYKSAERLAVGRASNVVAPVTNPYRHLPCGCPVCSAIKYVDVISHLDDSIIPHMLITHNMIEIDRWVKMVLHHAQTLDAKDFFDLSVAQTAGSPAERSIKPALRFIETVAGEGLPAAQKQFSHLLHSMFSTGRTDDGEGMFAEDRNIPADQPADYLANRLDTILRRYEDFHAHNKVPDGTRKRVEAKRTAKKVMMNSAVRRAGRDQLSKRRRMGKVELPAGASTHSKKRPAATSPASVK